MREALSTTAATIYGVNGWIKAGSGLATGALQIRLVDGTGTVINDNAGNPNSLTVTLTGLTPATWVPVNVVFRTPTALPASVNLQFKMSTLITGDNVFIDRWAVAPMNTPYAGSPSVAIFSGSTNLLVGDSWTDAISNNYGGGWQFLFDRVFGMRSLGMVLPNSGSPTIAAALIG